MMLLTTLPFVASIATIFYPVANLLLVDTSVLAAVELRNDIAFAALLLVALICTVGESIAAPLFRYAFAVSASEFILLAAWCVSV